VLSYLPDVADASRTPGSPPAGAPAGTVVVRAADLLVRGGKTVTARNAVLSAGELAVFCRPVVTAPAPVRRDGSVAAVRPLLRRYASVVAVVMTFIVLL